MLPLPPLLMQDLHAGNTGAILPQGALAAPVSRIMNTRKNGLWAMLNHVGLGKLRSGFIQNMSLLLGAGLPLADALRTLEREARVKPFKKIVAQIRADVERGRSLWQSMDDQAFFSPYAIALTRIGEEAGNLARNMEYLSAQQDKDDELRSKVTMAMLYPGIVLTLVFIVTVGLGGFVLPMLIPVLYSLNAPLPLATKVVIAVSDFFTLHGAVAVPSMVAAMFGVLLLHLFTPFRAVTQWVIFRIPGIGRLAKEATVARFGIILGGLLQSGVPLVDALQSLVDVTWIVSYKKFYKGLLARVERGESFANAFRAVPHSDKLIPLTVQELIIVGEQSGSFAKTLLTVATIYDRKAAETAQKLPVILEPMLLLFMGALVGTIAFAVIIPIYSVIGHI